MADGATGGATPFSGRPVPEWFASAGFGIFVHWTPSSVPAFAPPGRSVFEQAAEEGWERALMQMPYSEWYWNSLLIPGSAVEQHHSAVWGATAYEAFVRRFEYGLDRWEPEPWAELFAAAGARYVVLVTKHHDGFLLWPSSHPNPHRDHWQSRRDVVGELADAVRARGLRFGVYYSGGIDWTFVPPPIRDATEMLRSIPSDDLYCAYATAHWHELIERYQPDILWNDIGWPRRLDPHSLFAHYYDRVPEGVVNDRFDVIGVHSGTVHADFITPEYSVAPAGTRWKWETCRGIGQSFGYNAAEGPEWYLSGEAAVALRSEVVAAGGNLLLNVGPTADGTIPPLQQRVLQALSSRSG